MTKGGVAAALFWLEPRLYAADSRTSPDSIFWV